MRRATRPKQRVAAEPSFSEAGGIRYLHFSSPWIQGAMQIAKPNKLVLEYTRQMMAWLLFLEPPARVVQLGLGAGSLTKFTLAHCEQTAVQVVEIDASVIGAAYAMFRLPHSHPRLSMHEEDAERWVQEPRRHGSAQILQIDLYDTDAQGPTCASLPFYTNCWALLHEPGICVVNLFGRHASYTANRDLIDHVFEGRVLQLPEIEEGNRVVLAFKGPTLEVSWERLFVRADQLEERFGLPARKWVKSLRGTDSSAKEGLRI